MSKNFRTKSIFVPVLSCCLLGLGLTSALVAQSAESAPAARILITRPVDPGRLHTLAGNTRPEANELNDRGRVSDTFPMGHMLLEFERSPEREQALKTLIDQQHVSTSPNFHKWLTAEQFGQIFGPAPPDIEKVSDWLRSGGFTVNTVYPSGMLIDFSGTAGQVAAAFHTEIHRLSVNGKDHIANMSDPQIPEALAPVVAGIVSLHDFRPLSMKMPPTPKYSLSSQLVVPADLATIYDLNAAFAAGYTGKGQTIAVLEDGDLYNTADWYSFRKVFGLATYTSGSLSVTNPAPPSGSSNCSDPGVIPGIEDEAAIDVEWASAAAPDATIEMATCADSNTSLGVLFAAQNLINAKVPPQVISMSYGYCEPFNGVTQNAAYNSAFQQAVAEGVSVFVSAGDAGAAGCDRTVAAIHGISVSGMASTPYNVAVGGTDFADASQHTISTYWGRTNSSTYGSALSYIPEIPWNDSCAGSVLATYLGYSVGYGPGGFCGSSKALQFGNLTTAAGSGGPSGCATGVPAANFVVGGSCKGYSKPSWQAGVPGIPNDGVRDLPDVSLFAANGVWGHYYVYCFSDLVNGGTPCTERPNRWPGAGGTSFSSPIMAGIQALVNQKMGGAQGNPNPVYYKLAASSVASSVFHSITTGDIAVNCSGEINCFGGGFVGRGRGSTDTGFDGNGGLSTSSQSYTPAFAAASGWNFATGLGSVDAFNLILNWTKGQ